MSLHIICIAIFSGKRSAIIFYFFCLVLRLSLRHWFSTIWLWCGIFRSFLCAYHAWFFLNSWICELIVLSNLEIFHSLICQVFPVFPSLFRTSIIHVLGYLLLYHGTLKFCSFFSVFSSFLYISLDIYRYWFLCLQVHWSFLQQCLRAPLNLSTKYFISTVIFFSCRSSMWFFNFLVIYVI